MNINKTNKKKYEDEGYLILKNIIPTEAINNMNNFVSHVIALEGKSLMESRSYNKDEILNELLIKIKKNNPSSSSWIYQTILGSYALKEFFIKVNIEKYVMNLLGVEDKNNLGIVSPAFRFDVPNDKRNVRTWHQDSNYFLENENGTDHLVTWIPLNKAYKENGSVIIVPRTHKKGRLNREHVKADGFSSEQYSTSEKEFDNSNLVYVDAEPGDIAFINMDLIHGSGVNVTNNSVRYTAQIRFNTINRESYRPVILTPSYPEYQRLCSQN
jgi:ectoine hydroxylase-related dioxygenase (phytanoyl-CoA dioxygenase family)